MDAWASPWADDANQDEDPGHRRTVSTLQDFETLDNDTQPTTQHTGIGANFAYTSKLDTTDFGGASVWASDVNAFSGVDSSSAWASDSTGVPLPGDQHGDIYPEWGGDDLVSRETPLFVDETIPAGNATTESTKEVSDDWTHQLQSDWDSAAGNQPMTEALSIVPGAAQEESGGLTLQEDLPSVACVSTTEEILASTALEEKAVETVPTTSPDPNVDKPLIESKDSREAVEAVPTGCAENTDNPLVENEGSGKAVENEKVEDQRSGNDRFGAQAEEQGEDDDFGDFGDVEEGEIEDVRFEPEPELQLAPVAAAITDPLSPLDFTIDSTLASKLYPVAQKPPAIPPVEDIISAISTRKAWYRISRDGTMGKHNSGDGDDYVRVTWSKSRVRTDVCNIVARWIKEGRFSVSDAIGGDRSYGAMFGWGDGANTSSKDSGHKRNLSSAPMGFGLRGYREGSKSIHKASVSISSWDPLAPGKSDTPSVVDFGWASPKDPAQEANATKNAASSKEEQQSTTSILSISPNLISPDTINALKDFVIDTSMKPSTQPIQPSTAQVQSPPESLHNERVAVENATSGTDSWDDFKSTPIAAVPNTILPGQTVEGPVPSLSGGGDTWASLDLFEKKAVSDEIHASPSTSLESDLRNTGLSLDENVKKQPSVALEFESAVDDDDWGDIINSPATPVETPSPFPIIAAAAGIAIEKNRRPSTAHGDTNPFGTFHVGGFGAPKVAPTRRDSAPSLFSPTIADATAPGPVATTENYSAPTVDWDFSVFERPTKKVVVPSSPATFHISGSPGSILGGSQILSKEDNVVMNILEGLPDMGYMFR